MKIGIDIRAACGKKTGKGWYTFNLIKELLGLPAQNEYILYTNKISGDVAQMLAKLGPTSKSPHIKVIHKNPFLWHFAVIKDFLKTGGDIFFAPTSFIIPAFLPRLKNLGFSQHELGSRGSRARAAKGRGASAPLSGAELVGVKREAFLVSPRIKSVITVHDLMAFIHPRLHQTKATVLEHLFFKRALKKTSHVLVPSQNTKRDLMRLFRYPEAKITITPLAAGEEFFRAQADAEDDAAIKKKYNLPDEFALAVSGLEPRKNVGKLVDAAIKLNKKYPNLKLVIVGGKGWKSRGTQKKIKNAGAAVTHIENCGSQDLPHFYRLAKIFVFPSVYEGFGLPLLEAMASGCPVVCGKAAPMTEVCGDAAIYFSLTEEAALAAALEKIWNSAALRQELSKKGRERAKLFSWQKTAEKTLKVIKKAQKGN